MKAESTHCPSAAVLELLLAEQLPDPELDPVETHVEDCDSCQERLEEMIGKTLIKAGPSPAQYSLDPQPRQDFLRRLKRMPQPTQLVSKPAVSGNLPPVSDDHSTSERGDRFEKRRLGQYEILERLGKGSMGVVYKALHTELGKFVALKVLPASLTDEVAIARFKNEARAAGRLDHQNIVTAHDAGRAEDVHFLVMTFVDGIDLGRLVQRRGRLAIPDACELIRQAAVGLQHAFERGLVHRDIKPSNLMLARDGVVKVLDLGIARSCADTLATERLTAAGMLLGTADYLAPEQWDNPHAVDTRADIYSLGCSLYHLLAGDPPFSGPSYPSVMTKMRAHLEGLLPPIIRKRADVPTPLAAVLDRMLAKNPADRFATPGEVVEALKQFTASANLLALLEPGAADGTYARGVSGLEIAADTDQPAGTFSDHPSGERRQSRPMRSFPRRHGLALGLASVCLVMAIAVGLWVIQHSHRPYREPVKIEAMSVSQYRGGSATLLGDIGMTTQALFVDDSVRVSARLSAPAYCYLLAFNPDGKEQLCYPEDPDLPAVLYPEHTNAKSMLVRPVRSAELRFPRDQYFEPGIPGLQVFVMVASAEPLPAYAEWRSQVGKVPWQETQAYSQEWRWQFDGQDFGRLPTERGTRVERGAAPKEFRELCEFFRNRPDVQSVRALAFPVTKK